MLNTLLPNAHNWFTLFLTINKIVMKFYKWRKPTAQNYYRDYYIYQNYKDTKLYDK